MKRDLIEISELGEVLVLGVHIGMNKELAKKILAPEYEFYYLNNWKLKETVHGLKVEDESKKYSISFRVENEIIKSIFISRVGTKDKNERDEDLKYFLDKFKDLNICAKKTEETIYSTVFSNIHLYVTEPVFKDGQLYFVFARIDEEKFEGIINKTFDKKKEFESESVSTFGCILLWLKLICGLILLVNIVNILNFLSSAESGVIPTIIISILFFISIAYSIIYENKEYYFNKHKRLQEEAVNFVREIKKHSLLREKELLEDVRRYETTIKLSNDAWIKKQETLYSQKQNQLLTERNILLIKERLYEDTIKGSLFKRSASLYADYKVLELDAIETYLMTKKNPIKVVGTTAEELKKLKQGKKEDVARYKEMLYKWEFLMNLFPELSKYVDDDNDIQDLESYDGIDDFKENYDRARDYLTEEEYRNLSEDERNQRALDIWKGKRKPSKWIAGVEYEMYCAYLLRKKGFYVIEHGIQKGLNDLGIDLIARQQDATYIIQCKRYSNAEVHENTICQLFGTTLKYKIDRQDLFDTKIIPLLLTTGELTDTAKEFANKLGVIYSEWQMGDYPRIKCNINNGNKIYHLPFDQQYWRTIIEPEKGEFYAMTVKEATQAGFRRAFKYKLLGKK